MTKTTTKPTAKAPTIVTWPADPNVIPHYIATPDELAPLAEAARAALMRLREAGVEEQHALRALEAAPEIDRAAASQAGPDALPERTEPLRQAEHDEARRKYAAAEAKYKQAIRAQSAAIGPLHAEWLARHEEQVDERMQTAQRQLDELLETFSQIQTDLSLDKALRAYDPGARFGWWFDWRTSDVLAKSTAKAEARIRSIRFRRDTVPNELPELLATLRVHSTAWQIERENERRAARVQEIRDTLHEAGFSGPELERRLQRAAQDEDLHAIAA